MKSSWEQNDFFNEFEFEGKTVREMCVIQTVSNAVIHAY